MPVSLCYNLTAGIAFTMTHYDAGIDTYVDPAIVIPHYVI